jgi:Na+/H+ antiporter NhaD/arsenite permease-like protein/uncharacterized membrane protein (UPF0127 family)
VLFVITALVIFIITYFFIGIRQIPRLHINRPAGALVGAVLMIVFGVLTLDQAFAAIDMHTLLLLLGMMIITVYLRHAGFFELMADKILSLSKSPLQLLIFVVTSSGLLSALFVNDTICLLYTPIILEVTLQLRVNPVPYLLALATSSNVGSVMTVTGNPQNMLIGIYSKIPYLSFLGALFPVAIAGLAVCVAVIWFLYRNEIRADVFENRPSMPEYYVRKPLLAKSLLVSGVVIGAFSMGYPYSLVAVAGGGALLLFGGVSTERIFEGVDWTLLLFFAGLFVVMRGVEVSGLATAMIEKTGNLADLSPMGRITGLSAVSVILSNLVSNVPAVMLLKPLTQALDNGQTLWLALAMSSTLAGNLTLIGSVANLIVIQQARRHVEIGFLDYFRVGALITVITIAIGILVLGVEVSGGKKHRSANLSNGCPRSIYEGNRTICDEGYSAFMMSMGSVAFAETAIPKQQERPRTVTIRPSDPLAVPRTFKVVLYCNDDESRTVGLQGFRRLQRDEAALFVFEPPEAVTFWMGSVGYAIDIIYVDRDNKVVRVYPHCRPGSRDYYPSGERIRWVIETVAGSGIKAGDTVSFK